MKLWPSLAFVAMVIAGCGGHSKPTELAAPAKETPPAPPAAAPSENQLQTALNLQRDGKLADARDLLEPMTATTNSQVMELLSEINTRILFTPTPAPEKTNYTVVGGDSLGKLAKKFGTTIELIKKSNNLNRDMIKTDERLRIYQSQFAVEVNRTANTLTLTDHGKFFKRYRVGTGQFAKTPVGEFTITTRVEHPPWFRPDGKTIPFGDRENILGTHWLGLNVSGYGIHGTWETNSIGKQASAGCIRLLNDDVAELYTILPVGTPVTIHD